MLKQRATFGSVALIEQRDAEQPMPGQVMRVFVKERSQCALSGQRATGPKDCPYRAQPLFEQCCGGR